MHTSTQFNSSVISDSCFWFWLVIDLSFSTWYCYDFFNSCCTDLSRCLISYFIWLLLIQRNSEMSFFFFLKALNQNNYTPSCKNWFFFTADESLEPFLITGSIRSLVVKLCPLMIHPFHRTLHLIGKCTLHWTPSWRALRTQGTGCHLITFNSLVIVCCGGTQNGDLARFPFLRKSRSHFYIEYPRSSSIYKIILLFP